MAPRLPWAPLSALSLPDNLQYLSLPPRSNSVLWLGSHGRTRFPFSPDGWASGVGARIQDYH